MGHGSDAGRHVVWRQRLERFAGWTGTVAEFCRREGVAQPTFYQWRKRLQLAGEPATVDATKGLAGARVAEEATRGRARFVELSVAAAAAVEISCALQQMSQFTFSRETRSPLANVFLSGLTEDEMQLCPDMAEALNLNVGLPPLSRSLAGSLFQRQFDYGEYLYCLGDLID